GGDSPIIVILNKVDEHPAFDLNRRFLKSKYPGISEFFRVSCASGAGLDQFREQLTLLLTSVPILQTRWPSSWFNVKRKLEGLGQAYLSLSEFHRVCLEEGVKDEESQEALV